MWAWRRRAASRLLPSGASRLFTAAARGERRPPPLHQPHVWAALPKALTAGAPCRSRQSSYHESCNVRNAGCLIVCAHNVSGMGRHAVPLVPGGRALACSACGQPATQPHRTDFNNRFCMMKFAKKQTDREVRKAWDPRGGKPGFERQRTRACIARTAVEPRRSAYFSRLVEKGHALAARAIRLQQVFSSITVGRGWLLTRAAPPPPKCRSGRAGSLPPPALHVQT